VHPKFGQALSDSFGNLDDQRGWLDIPSFHAWWESHLLQEFGLMIETIIIILTLIEGFISRAGITRLTCQGYPTNLW